MTLAVLLANSLDDGGFGTLVPLPHRRFLFPSLFVALRWGPDDGSNPWFDCLPTSLATPLGQDEQADGIEGVRGLKTNP